MGSMHERTPVTQAAEGNGRSNVATPPGARSNLQWQVYMGCILLYPDTGILDRIGRIARVDLSYLGCSASLEVLQVIV